MSDEDKIRENRLRRAAQRQGLMLAKSRRRDPRATDYGVYFLSEVTAPGGNWRSRELLTSEAGINLDEVEAFLTSERKPS
jgi:hypothetical protein